MPELPDLQVFSANLNQRLAGSTLKEISVPKGVKLDSPAAALKKTLEGKKLTKVYREGKELRFAFSNKSRLGLHLMLRGKLDWVKDEIPRHVLIDLLFTGNKRLVMTDYQRRAKVVLDPQESKVPDALSKDLTLDYLKEILQSKGRLKNILLDQHLIRGIGNAYADEILWEAGISPFSISNKIPPARVKALHTAIKKVLTNAERQIKKKSPGIIGGEIRDFLLIHNSSKKKSPTGAGILSKTTGGRKTYYTDEQELFD
jgi:formamidopyrimidine-DNA glycosylase